MPSCRSIRRSQRVSRPHSTWPEPSSPEVPGFIRLRLSHCLESPERYLLLVEWAVESHTIGFRQSTGYEKWRELLHHFYEPFPTVEHYSTLFEV